MQCTTKKIPLIDIQTICSQSRTFDLRHQERVREAAGRNRGVAAAVIHPQYCLSLVRSPAEISGNYFMQSEINPKDYSSYLRRLEEYFKKTLGPIFVFVGKSTREEREAWIENLTLSAVVIMVNTTNEGHPTPDFQEQMSEREAWRTFVNILKYVEISQLMLMGEKAYIEGQEKIGCVYSAHEALTSFIPTTIVSELTYPNLRALSHSDK